MRPRRLHSIASLIPEPRRGSCVAVRQPHQWLTGYILLIMGSVVNVLEGIMFSQFVEI